MTHRLHARSHCFAALAAHLGKLGGSSLLALGLSLSVACKKDEDEKAEPEKKAQPSDEAATAAKAKATEKKKPAPPKFVPLEWDDPKTWKRVEPSSRMRKASYEVPPVKGDAEKAELNVFILGGDIEPNIQRWVGEFSNFEVKDVVRVDRTVGGIQQAVVEIPKGDFSGGMASLEGGKGYGLLGAIAVSPSGAKYFFKMTGPSKTVVSARDAFYGLLDSMRVEGGKPGKVEEAKPEEAKSGEAKPEEAKPGEADSAGASGGGTAPPADPGAKK